MSPQQTIAHYRITAKLGAGGMGEVYRATDTKLGREVAIKVIPETLAQDPDRMARFAREAQVLASLNHPNIAVIHGVEERAIVMELVDGETLAERIAAGPMPLDETLPIAKQIVEALEYAHERGVVHRDLKPANIKITGPASGYPGRVKVLDFGLAKALSPDASGLPGSADPAASPTLTMRATVAGFIVGTAGYMSPEQARGQAVDRRADIWAFGVVLYEMLTGRGLFQAPTISDTLAAVLRADPDWSALPSGLPSNIRTMLRRCLERDPRRRLRDIGDARLELEQPAGEQPAAVAVPPAPRFRLIPWIMVAVLAVAAAALAAIHFREAPAPAPQVRFGVPAPDKGTFGVWLGLSPNGRFLGFTGTGPDGVERVWIRSLDSLEVRPLPGTETTTTFFWSPDSRFVVFQSAGKLKKIDVSGGPPQTLCDAPGVMLGGTWNSDGVILFGSNSAPILRVSSTGGVATPVTGIDPSRAEGSHSDPVFLPDGRHFLYFRRSSHPELAGIFAGSLDVQPGRQNIQRIQAAEFRFGYAPPRGALPGYLLFMRDGTLMAQVFDERRLEAVGEAVPVADQVGTSLTRAFFSVSANGVLAYRTGSGANSQISWFDRQGHNLGSAGAVGEHRSMALSPDGAQVAHIQPGQGSGWQIWLLDMARGANTRLTFMPEGAGTPVWSPDGKRLAFGSIGAATGTGNALYLKDASNSGTEQLVFRSSQLMYVNDWSRDGRFLVYAELSLKNGMDLWALPDPLAGGDHKPIPLANSAFNEAQGQVSPDSRWLAYASDESGEYEIYVRPFPPGDGRTGKSLVSSAGGVEPRWRGDGKELFYIGPDTRLMAVDITAGAAFQAGVPHALFATQVTVRTNNSFRYDVTRDGQRFLMVVPTAGVAAAPATVVLNWEAGLKR